MIEQTTAGRVPDILTFERLPPAKSAGEDDGG
jgi:hypothetical protein